MKKLLTASAAILAITGSAALAADFPALAPMPMAAPVAAGPSWTGFYLGAGGGWQWGEFDLDHATFDDALAVEVITPLERAFGANIDVDGPLATVTGGFDWQAGRFVLGAFASYDFLFEGDGEEENEVCFTLCVEEFEGQRWEVELDDIVTVAGRAGFLATDHVLLYGLVGWSWAEAEVAYFEGCEPVGACTNNLEYSGSEWTDGLTYGAGAEVIVWNNLSLGVEYRHIDFDDVDASGSRLAPDFSGETGGDVEVDSIRGVVRIRFGG